MSNDLARVELEIETAKTMIKLRDDLAHLQENKYFKEVIEEGYFRHEMRRLVMLKGANVDEPTQAMVDKRLLGIGALNSFFNDIIRRGDAMEQELSNHESTREEILAEEIE